MPRLDLRPDWAQRATAIGSIVSVLVLGAGLYSTNTANNRQAQLTAQAQTSDQFSRAIEQLGSPKLDVRLGGIYGLERLMKVNGDDQSTVVEVLSAYVRDHAPTLTSPPAEAKDEPTAKPATDFQAALTVLGRQPGTDRTAPDLSGANLSGANLTGANLEGADLAHANLAGANLSDADLTDAWLSDSDLTDAWLPDANLAGAVLYGANLAGATLYGANLAGATLADANLYGAYLTDTNLTDADLVGANLAGATLTDANLAGANLTGVVGLPPQG